MQYPDSSDDNHSTPPSSSLSSAGTLFPSSSSSGGGSSSSDDSVEITGDAPAVVTATCEKCVGRQDRVSWGTTSVIGRRREMEDAIAVVPGFMSGTCCNVGGCTVIDSRSSCDLSPVHFFGVYDGHGGTEVANYCAKRMHGIILEELSRERFSEHGWQKKWQEAFCTGFRRADDLLISENVALETAGSTAVVAVVSGCHIILSNCGDSRAVLCKRTQTIPLTVDHKPDRPDELSRIEGQGGRVINWNGIRVSGVLAMSRAIGDRFLSPYIIPVPEISFMTRSDEDECLILASDGLWDVMSNGEVGEVARRLLRRMRRSMVAGDKSPAQVIADTLTQLATGRNSSDNISIIVVDLKSKRRHQTRQ